MVWHEAKLGNRRRTLGVKEQLRLLKYFHLLSCFLFSQKVIFPERIQFQYNIILNVC